MSKQLLMYDEQDIELTADEKSVIDVLLNNFKNNPSNSNKFRIGLHAYFEELVEQKISKIINQGDSKNE